MKKILSLIIALTVVLTVTSFCFGAQASTALTPEDKKLIAQLQPPATAEERAMFEEIKNNPGEVTKFIATRQYFWKLREMFPNGKIDPARAPFPSADVKIKYTLQENNNEEWGWLFSIDYALIKKGITPPER